MGYREYRAHPAWQKTGNPRFPIVARFDKSWWVLRANAFPDHPMWTLFVDGQRRFDVDDPPAAWGSLAEGDLPAVDESTAVDVLRAVKKYTAFGSEVGRACDNPLCCG